MKNSKTRKSNMSKNSLFQSISRHFKAKSLTPGSDPDMTSDAPQHSAPATSNPQPPTNPSPPDSSPTAQPVKRKGKIAELPRVHRDTINRLLEDGASYKTVELEMLKHGISLNAENISNWFDGGFQDYL